MGGSCSRACMMRVKDGSGREGVCICVAQSREDGEMQVWKRGLGGSILLGDA